MVVKKKVFRGRLIKRGTGGTAPPAPPPAPRPSVSGKGDEVVTREEFERIKERELQKRIAETTKKIEEKAREVRPSVSGKGDEVVTRPEFERIKEQELQRRIAETTAKIEERAREEGPLVLKRVSTAAAVLGLAALETPRKIVTKLFKDTFLTPEGEARIIGRVKTGDVLVTRDVSREGVTLRETREEVEEGQEVLLPGVAEQVAVVGKVIAAPLIFLKEEAPELIEKGIELVKSGEAKKRLEEAIDSIKKNPKEAALVAASLGLSVLFATIEDAQENPVKFATELILIGEGIKGIGKLTKATKKGIKTAKFERTIKQIEKGLDKIPEAEVRARLRTGGIITPTGQIQTTFGISPRVITAEEVARIRILEAAKRPLKRPEPPTRISIIESPREILKPTGKRIIIPQEARRIITLERVGRFDTTALKAAGQEFNKIRVALGDIPRIRIIEKQTTLGKRTIEIFDLKRGVSFEIDAQTGKIISKTKLPQLREFVDDIKEKGGRFEIEGDELVIKGVERKPTVEKVELVEIEGLAKPTLELQRRFPFVEPPRIVKPRNIFEEIRVAEKARALERLRVELIPRIPSAIGADISGAISAREIIGISQIQPQVQPSALLPSQIQAQIVTPDIIISQITEVTPVTTTTQIQQQVQIQEQSQIQEQIQRQEQELIQLQDLKQRQKLTTTQKIREEKLTDEIKKAKGRARRIRLFTGTGKPVILSKEEQQLRKQAYKVLVREGEKRTDKFKKVASGLPINKALRLGSKIVDNFIEASYRIVKTKRLAKIRDDLSPPNLAKFRGPVPGSKLPRDTIIERVQHRIDTIGEKQQLAFFKELKAKRQSALSILRAARTQQVNIIVTQKKQQQINFIATQKKKKNQQANFIKSSRGGSKFL